MYIDLLCINILHINKLILLSYSINSKLPMRWKRKPDNQKSIQLQPYSKCWSFLCELTKPLRLISRDCFHWHLVAMKPGLWSSCEERSYTRRTVTWMETSPFLLFENETETEPKQEERENKKTNSFQQNAMNVWLCMWFLKTLNCFTSFLSRFCHQMNLLQTPGQICSFQRFSDFQIMSEGLQTCISYVQCWGTSVFILTVPISGLLYV